MQPSFTANIMSPLFDKRSLFNIDGFEMTLQVGRGVPTAFTSYDESPPPYDDATVCSD